MRTWLWPDETDDLPFRRCPVSPPPSAQGNAVIVPALATPPLVSRDAVAGAALFDPNMDPGATNRPVVFEPPAPLSGGVPEIWVIATGGTDWGGCTVYVSTDDATYAPAGVIYRGGRQGVLSAPLPAVADPDTTSTLAVDLSQSAAQLLSGTKADADAYVTLCYCDGELVSYETATLTGANAYNLTYLRRGAYGTAIGAHSAGGQFARIGPIDRIGPDMPVFRYFYPANFVGKTIYLKLPAFNLFGGAAEDLSTVSAYAYQLTGAGLSGGTGYVAPTPIPLAPRRWPIEEPTEEIASAPRRF